MVWPTLGSRMAKERSNFIEIFGFRKLQSLRYYKALLVCTYVQPF